VAAYRQVQGLSHQLFHLTNQRHRIDLFQLPQDSHVRPVQQGESRRTVTDACGDHVYIRNIETGEEKRVLPQNLVDVKLLVLQLDQGSIGAAGVAYLEYYLEWMVTVKFDKIHRCIRDLKLAAGAVPIFVKTKLWSSYLFSLNKRPFGSGAFGTAKSRLLETFRDHVDIHSRVFLKYLPRLSRQWGMPMETESQRQDILDRICMMPSFTRHMAHPKLQNWFAWNKCTHDQLDEFFGSKCIFESELGQQADPEEEQFSMSPSTDVRAELQRILKGGGYVILFLLRTFGQLFCFLLGTCGKLFGFCFVPVESYVVFASYLWKVILFLLRIPKGGGGIPLAYRLMKTGLYQHIKVLWYCEKATWDWYTAEIKGCKSPLDALAYSIRNVEWCSEKHLYETLSNGCLCAEYLEDMQVPFGNSDLGAEAVQFAWRIVARRGWTLSKHSCPPESYARILQVANPENQRQTAEKMKREHTNSLKLEADRHAVPAAKDLWEDIIFLRSRPIRCVFEFYKRDRYSPNSRAGKKLMCGLLWTMESNKAAEDIHQPIRMDAAANQNRKLSKDHIQDLIVHSGSLEAREVHHGAKVSKEEFLREFASTSTNKKTAFMHDCVRHKLPTECARMMKPGVRPWPALTEDNLNKAAAAWSWLHKYFELREREVDVSIGSGRLSKLLQPCTIARRISDQAIFATLGNALWAGLGMPLTRFEANGQMHSKFKRAPLQFLHVYDPSDWEVLPFLVIRLRGHGLVMQDRGGPVPLMLNTLRSRFHMLTAPDIERCCEHLGAEVHHGIEEGLEALSKCFCRGDNFCGPSEAGHVIKQYFFRNTSDEDLLKDPLVEAVFDDLDPDDKEEFKSMQEARKKQRYKRALAEEDAEAVPAPAPKRRRAVPAPAPKRRRRPPPWPLRRRRPGAAPPAAAAPPAPAAPGTPPGAAAAAEGPALAPGPPAAEPAATPPAAAAEGPGPPEPALAPGPPAAEPAAPPAAAAAAAHNRGPNVLPPLAWQDIICQACGKVSGQMKHHPLPGLRDAPSWYMRCYDYRTATWPSKLPGYRCKVQNTMVGEPGDFIRQWVQENRSCCQL
jgi:hypothetical protein